MPAPFSPGDQIGSSVLVYRYTVKGSDKASIDTGVDAADAGSNDWTNCDLIEVFLYSRTDDTGINPSLTFILNNDSGANYDYQWNRLFSTGSSNTNTNAASSIGVQSAGGGIANTTTFSPFSMAFINPTGAVGYKPYVGMFGYADPGDASQTEIVQVQGQYRSTSALTRLSFAPSTGGKKLKVGTQLLIYKRLAL